MRKLMQKAKYYDLDDLTNTFPPFSSRLLSDLGAESMNKVNIFTNSHFQFNYYGNKVSVINYKKTRNNLTQTL